MAREYRICVRCIMDTSDPDITFNAEGVCCHCLNYDVVAARDVQKGEGGKKKLEELVASIKRAGEGKKYDCIIGVSGGVDSSYLAYQVKELGLRPLAVHLDNGWNSELAVNNIEGLLRTLGIDLYTHVIDWEEFKDIQTAFLKASTPDAEIPSDHAIQAILFDVAAREGVKYILIGRNVVTEGYGVPAWSQGHGDWRYIRSVHKKFGSGRSIKTFPRLGILKRLYYKLIKRIAVVSILDYVPYVKKEALKVLTDKLGYRPYPGKHYESIYTSFYQSYILPKKFGYDKRRIHLSALIASGQMTRAEALAEMEKELAPQAQLERDREYVLKKLELSEAEFEGLMKAPPKTMNDYPSYKSLPVINNPSVRKVLLKLVH